MKAIRSLCFDRVTMLKPLVCVASVLLALSCKLPKPGVDVTLKKRSNGATKSNTPEAPLPGEFPAAPKWGVIGQPDLETNYGKRYSGTGLSGLFFDGSKLYAGEDHSRVLVWNGAPVSNSVPSHVIAQNNLDTIDHWYGMFTSANTVSYETYPYSDGVRLYVSDTANHRILIWDTIPQTSGVPADIVLGQTTMTANSANAGIAANASTLNSPKIVRVIGSKFVVADSGNNRVLIWNSPPIASYQPADLVLGQSDFATTTCNQGGLGADSLCSPRSVDSNGGNLVVADTGNHRVLIYNSLPTANRASANVVVGQTDFISNSANNGGVSKAVFSSPVVAKIGLGQLFVVDQGNNRVLTWSSIPFANGVSANVVLGQPNGTSNTLNNGGRSAARMNNPFDVTFAGSSVYVSDVHNYRILRWNTFPVTDGVAADTVIRQTSPTLSVQHGHPFSDTYAGLPQGVAYCDGKLVVSDHAFSRVMIWNSIPSNPATPPDILLGQTNMIGLQPNKGTTPNASSLSQPSGVLCHGGKLLVVDMYNHRILIWNSFPTTTNQPADVVIGAPNMTSVTPGTSASTFHYPSVLTMADEKLLVSDYLNSRVLIFNSIPTSNGASANVVIGQPDMTSSTANNGGISDRSLNLAQGVVYHAGKLVIGDGNNNNRMLVWNTLPTTNFAQADVVIGQPNFTASATGLTASANYGLSPMVIRAGKLVASDFYNNRVLVWNEIPTANGQAADRVLFQKDFFSRDSGISGSLIAGPGHSADSGTHLLMIDYFNSRLLVIPWDELGL